MLRRLLLLAVILFVAVSLSQAKAPRSQGSSRLAQPVRAELRKGSTAYPSGIPLPSSPDNWLGGSGNWSIGSAWSAGVPGSGSDVTINTGNDAVTLGTSTSINSLTLGGASGSSTLTYTSSAADQLTIAGALTVNHSGTLTLGNNRVVANGASANYGNINLLGGFSGPSQLTVNADFTNAGTIQMSAVAGFGVNGTLTNSGLIEDTDPGCCGGSSIYAGDLNNSGDIYITDLIVGSTLTNQSNAVLNVQSLTVNNLINAGTVMGLQSTNISTINGQLTNSGNFDLSYTTATIGSISNSGRLEAGYITVSGDVYNSGSISEDYEGQYLTQRLTIEGTFTNTATGFLQLYGPNIWGLYAVNINNAGTIDLEQQSPMYAANVTNTGTISSGSLSGGNYFSLNKLTNSAGAIFSMTGAGDTATIGNVINMGSVTVGNGASLTVPPGARSGGNSYAGFFNAGSVLIAQGGTLSSPAKYTQTTGQTTVDGRLSGVVDFAGGSVYGNNGTISGSVTSNASINFGDVPMTVGQLAFAGNYTQGANGSLTFDIASSSQYDRMNVTGQAHLNGTMTIDLLHGYVPQVGNDFEIMTFAGGSGTFSNVVGLPINGQEHFTLQYNSTNLTLDVVSGALAGLSAITLGSSNSEPFVETAEGSGLQMTMNQGVSQTTPEPGTFALFGSGFAGIAWLLRRRKAGF